MDACLASAAAQRASISTCTKATQGHAPWWASWSRPARGSETGCCPPPRTGTDLNHLSQADQPHRLSPAGCRAASARAAGWSRGSDIIIGHSRPVKWHPTCSQVQLNPANTQAAAAVTVKAPLMLPAAGTCTRLKTTCSSMMVRSLAVLVACNSRRQTCVTIFDMQAGCAGCASQPPLPAKGPTGRIRERCIPGKGRAQP